MNYKRKLITSVLQTRSVRWHAHPPSPKKRPYTKSQPWKPFFFFLEKRLRATSRTKNRSNIRAAERNDLPNSQPKITSGIITKLSTTLVSEYKAILPSLLVYFHGRTQTFKANSLTGYSHIWQELTSDSEILETVTVQNIEVDTLQLQIKP